LVVEIGKAGWDQIVKIFESPSKKLGFQFIEYGDLWQDLIQGNNIFTYAFKGRGLEY
jgi:hypothetical protein